LVILNITIGVHLVHPVLHDHAAEDHAATAHSVHHPHAIIEMEEDHSCPICDFLAANQLHPAISGVSSCTNGPLGQLAYRVYSISIKTCFIQDNPRAPPLAI
jgi:hypothetical protein